MNKFIFLSFLKFLNIFAQEIDHREQLIRDADFSAFVQHVKPGTISTKEIAKYQSLIKQIVKEKNTVPKSLMSKKNIEPGLKILGSFSLMTILILILNDARRQQEQHEIELLSLWTGFFATYASGLTIIYFAFKSFCKNTKAFFDGKDKETKNLLLIHSYLENLK